MNIDDWVQTGIGLFLISVVLADAGLTIGWLLRSRGLHWRSMAYRCTLVCLLAAAVLTFVMSGRIANRYSIVQPGITPTISTVSVVASSPPKISVDASTAQDDRLPASYDADNHLGLRKLITLTTVFVIWCMGIVIGMIWLGAGAISLLRLKKDAEDADDDAITTLIDQLSERLNINAPRVLVHPGVDSPFLSGIVKPAIYLPENYCNQYDDVTLRAIIAHELSHLANRDCLFFYLSRICMILFWINPLVWLLHRQLDLVSEEICDATVVTLDCSPVEYANSLLSLAERLRPTSNAFAIGVVPIKSTLGKRIQAILSQSGNRIAFLSGKVKGSAVFVSLCIVLFAVFALCPSGMTSVGQYPRNYADNFTLAKEMGWSIAPVYRDKSLIKLGTMSPVISESDLRLMHARHLSKDDRHANIYFGCFEIGHNKDTKDLLEKRLTENPSFFYNEYCMAMYYADRGDFTQYRKWLQRSIEHAPMILAGRVQFDNGKPVAYYHFDYYFSVDQTADKSPNCPVIDYSILTDSNGCYYIPCYKSCYTLSASSYNAHDKRYKDTIPVINTFGTVCNGYRVGLLPPIYMRPYIEFDAKWSLDKNHPTNIQSDSIDFSWKPNPQVTYYQYILDDMLLPGVRIKSPAHSLHITEANLRMSGRGVHSLYIAGYKGDTMYCQSRTVYFENDMPIDAAIGSLMVDVSHLH